MILYKNSIQILKKYNLKNIKMGCSNSKNTKAKEPEVEELEEPEDVPEVECEAEAKSTAEVAVDAPEEATVEATEVETVTEAE